MFTLWLQTSSIFLNLILCNLLIVCIAVSVDGGGCYLFSLFLVNYFVPSGKLTIWRLVKLDLRTKKRFLLMHFFYQINTDLFLKMCLNYYLYFYIKIYIDSAGFFNAEKKTQKSSRPWKDPWYLLLL